MAGESFSVWDGILSGGFGIGSERGRSEEPDAVGVAQGLERRVVAPEVGGSNPLTHPTGCVFPVTGWRIGPAIDRLRTCRRP